MPRIRTVKPEFASDEKMAQVSRDARLTFVLTWTIADDDGLFRASPRQLLGALYPHDAEVSEVVLETWMAELVGIGVIRWRETHDGARIGEIVNWGAHQTIKNRSNPFLKERLRTLSGGSTESLPSPSGGSRKKSAAEPNSLEPVSLEPSSLQPNAAAYVRDCVIALNTGMAENPTVEGEWMPLPVSTQHGRVTWFEDGIPLDVAIRVISERAKAFRSTPRSRGPRSLKYFDGAVREAWEGSQFEREKQVVSETF